MNTRRQEILRHIGTGTCGIEVAPWFKPIIPRGEERKVVVLDLFDRPTLLARAENDPNIDRAMIPQIGEVDLVGSACDIAGLALKRTLPDPGGHIRFCGFQPQFRTPARPGALPARPLCQHCCRLHRIRPMGALDEGHGSIQSEV